MARRVDLDIRVFQDLIETGFVRIKGRRNQVERRRINAYLLKPGRQDVLHSNLNRRYIDSGRRRGKSPHASESGVYIASFAFVPVSYNKIGKGVNIGRSRRG